MQTEHSEKKVCEFLLLCGAYHSRSFSKIQHHCEFNSVLDDPHGTTKHVSQK